MANLTATAIRLYRRLFGSPEFAGVLEPGEATVLDGQSAVAIAEASIADCAVLGSSFPAESAGLAWLSEQQRQGRNLFGSPLASQTCEGPRGSLAAAIGLAMGGHRATAFVNGQDLAASQDLLVSAVGRHLPLVVHLSTRALAAQGGALGSGHEALHLASDTGCFILFAQNVQEAADFTLIARRVAEQTLVPALVVMDNEQTALAAQEVVLPSPALAKRFLGKRDEPIDSPNSAQKLLFGAQRPRVPRWHDLDRPVMQGALQEADSYALGKAAQAPFFSAAVQPALAEAFTEFAHLTGRRYGALSLHNTEKAKHLLLVQGAAIESARALCDHLNKTARLKLGVVGLHTLRPWPSDELTEVLRGKQSVAVLERLDTPLAGDAPLMRELRASLNGHEAPKLKSVIYGLGGLPLRNADLATLCQELARGDTRQRYLGISFDRNDSQHPKRQVMLDSLRRSYPELAERGLQGSTTIESRADNSLHLSIHRSSGEGHEGLAVEMANLLQQGLGGMIRSQSASSWQRWGKQAVDHITQAPQGLMDVDLEAQADVALISTPSLTEEQTLKLRQGGALLLTTATQLSANLKARLTQQNIQLFQLKLDKPNPAQLLGALCGTLIDSGQVDLKARKFIAAYTELHGSQDSTDFEAGLEQIEATTIESITEAHSQWTDEAPQVVRHLGEVEDSYASLPRFWDQVGVLYRNGEQDNLTVDPYLATATVPPLSATFHSQAGKNTMLPSFEADACTGCGQCWSACPDSAIGATAFTPKALLDQAILKTGASSVRPMVSKLASRIASLGRKGEAESSTLGSLIDEAFAWLEEKSPLAEERREATLADLNKIKAHVGELPISFTDTLFQSAEKAAKESGSLLSLVLNADACKGCALCVKVCEAEALTAAPMAQEQLGEQRQRWQQWQQSPDTDSATIERVGKGEMGPMAAVMLSRYCAFALSGGDSAEAGSGEKIALRQVLAAAEYQQQPLLHRFLAQVSETHDEVNARIKDLLSQALPTEDLNKLAASLEAVKTRQADIGALTSGQDLGGIDVPELKALTNIAQQLGDLHWRLGEGQHGLGRARFGLAIAPGNTATWAATFPNNPFHVPVTVDMTGETAQMAAGLMRGQLEEALASIRLLHKARELLKSGLGRGESPADKLGWDDLSDEERQLCPPLFLVGSDEALAGRGLAQISGLMNSGLPVKVVVLSSLDFGLADSGHAAEQALPAMGDSRNKLGLMALSQRSALVAQSSIAHPAHLRESVRQALKYSGPALLNIHAPSPEQHGFAVDSALDQAKLAVACRAHPLFRYNPQGEGVFGSRLTLDDNPAQREDWSRDASEQLLTMAHWAASEARFASRMTPLKNDAPKPTALMDWLALERSAQSGKTPFIVLGAGDEQQRYRVDPALARTVGEQADGWRTLQELAGQVTPFTAQVEAEAKQSLAAAHQAELEALKQEYEAKIQAIQNGMHTEMHQRIRGQLMSLAGYDPSLLGDEKH